MVVPHCANSGREVQLRIVTDAEHERRCQTRMQFTAQQGWLRPMAEELEVDRLCRFFTAGLKNRSHNTFLSSDWRFAWESSAEIFPFLSCPSSQR